MPLTSPPLRPVSPADRPPPRDPQAAGGPRDPDEPGFATALKDNAATANDQPSAASPTADGASPKAAPNSDEQADAPTDRGDAAAENGSGLTLNHVFSAAHLPVPGQTALSQTAVANTAANEEGREGKEIKPSSLAAAIRRPRDIPAADRKADEKITTNHKTEELATALGESRVSPETPSALSAHASPVQRPAESISAAPALATAATTPQTPVIALPAAIALRALDGMSRFDIRLDPDDLGRVDVALEIDGNGNIRASIAAEKPEALQLIVREARALEQAFDQAGFQRDDNALSFSLSDRQNPSQSQQDQPPRPQVTRFFVDGETEPLPPVVAARLNTADGRLDVRI